jgi:hypothetical protein
MTTQDHLKTYHNNIRAGRSTPPPSIPVDQTFGIGNLSEVEKSSFLFQPPDLGESGQQGEGSDPHLGDLPCELSAQLEDRRTLWLWLLYLARLMIELSLSLTWRDVMLPLT